MDLPPYTHTKVYELPYFPPVPTHKIGHYTTDIPFFPPVPTDKIGKNNAEHTDKIVRQVLKEAESTEAKRRENIQLQLQQLRAANAQPSGCIGIGCNIMGGSKRRRRNKKSSTRRKRRRSNKNKNKSKKH